MDCPIASGVNPPPKRASIRGPDDILCPAILIEESSRWLLVSMTTKMLDQLALVDVVREDLGEDDAPEDESIAESDLGWESWTPIGEPLRPAPSMSVKRVKAKPHTHPVLAGSYRCRPA